MSKKAVQLVITPTLLHLNGIVQTRLPLLNISELSVNWSRRKVVGSAGLRAFLRSTLPVLRYHNPHVTFNVNVQGRIHKPFDFSRAAAASSSSPSSSPSSSSSSAPSPSPSSVVSSSSKSDSAAASPSPDVNPGSVISLRSSSSSSSATVVSCHHLTDLEILHRIFAFDGQRLDDSSFTVSQLKSSEEREDYSKKIDEAIANRWNEMKKLQVLGAESKKRDGFTVIRYEGPPKVVRKRTLAIRKAYLTRKAKSLANAAGAGTATATAPTETATQTTETEKKEKGKAEKK